MAAAPPPGTTTPAATAPTALASEGPAGVVQFALADAAARAVDGRTLARGPDGHLIFPVNDNGYVRSDLLVGVVGGLEVEVVHRRYRGRRTDSLFGGGEAPLVGLSGHGFALLSLGDQRATAVTLHHEELYLVENAVVAFGNGLVWENGRLPSESDRDLDIVHLRGDGRVVLGSKRPVVSFHVTADAPCVVHAARLVGWSGQLLPFRSPLPGLPESARRIPVVRFEGSGVVLAV
jgi:uncharacterized protein (AIM24 family)